MSNHTPETITIQLTKGYTTVIDVDDADLAQFKWCAFRATEPSRAYAGRNSGNQVRVRMHRIIAERIIGRSLTPDEVVDHIDGNALRNTRSNLRVTTQGKNVRNQRKRSDNSSGYKGVYFHKQTSKWVAQIDANNKHYYLGSYDTPELAYEAYCDAAKRMHGEFARLE